MNIRLLSLQLVCTVGCLSIPSAALGQVEELSRVTFGGGAGITTITGHDAGKLDHGGTLQLTGGYFFNDYLGVTGNFTFSHLGITRSELDSLKVPDGRARVYSFTVDPTLRLPLTHGYSAYVLAGGGYLRRTVEFSAPTVAQTMIFDPWWGYFGPALIPVNQILGTVTSNSGAFDVGGGLNIPLPQSRAKLYVEARYFKGFTANTDTTVVPITFGIRW